LIDIDEFGIVLQNSNEKTGVGAVSLRICKAGHYCQNTKVTMILAMEPGDPNLLVG
jgi:hypothetical protein